MGKTILVIEDNNDIRENTAEILDLAGYKTFTAENGKRGVEIALKEKPSVIVCDIMMPELDGYGVLHLLRKNPDTENIPFIFLTAKTERSDFRKGMEMGADDYITKPFEDIELLNAVEMRLKKSAILEQKYTPSSQGLQQFLKDVRSTGIIEKLSEEYEVDHFDKKQVLYSEGKRPRFLYFLVKGKETGSQYIGNDWYSLKSGFSMHGIKNFKSWADKTNHEKTTPLTDSQCPLRCHDVRPRAGYFQ